MNYIIRLIILLGGGALLASPYLLQRWPKLVDSINKLALYKNVIGIAALLMGIFVDLPDYFKLSSDTGFISGTIILVNALVQILMGYLLAFDAIFVTFFKNNDRAMKTFQNFYDKIVKYQTPLGIIAIAWAVVIILRRVLLT